MINIGDRLRGGRFDGDFVSVGFQFADESTFACVGTELGADVGVGAAAQAHSVRTAQSSLLPCGSCPSDASRRIRCDQHNPAHEARCAADIATALMTDEVCDSLVSRAHWSYDEYEEWLSTTLTTLLLRG